MVEDEGLRPPAHDKAGALEPPAEIDVLRASAEPGIQRPDLFEYLPPNRDVHELEPRQAVTGRPVSEFRPAACDVALDGRQGRKRDRLTHDGGAFGVESGQELRQPRRADDAVSVGEDDDLADALFDPAVPSLAVAGAFLANAAHRKAPDDLGGGIGGRVVDDDDLALLLR